MKPLNNKFIFQYYPQSSFISAVFWNKKNRILVVIFSSGSCWAYYEVSEQTYNELRSADSCGNYFNNNIRNIYTSSKLESVTSSDYQSLKSVSVS